MNGDIIALIIYVSGIAIGAIITGIASSRVGTAKDREDAVFTGVLMTILWPAVICGIALAAPLWGLFSVGKWIGNLHSKKTSKKLPKEATYKKQIARLRAKIDEQKTEIAELRGYRD